MLCKFSSSTALQILTNHDETLSVHFDWMNLEKAGSLVLHSVLEILGPICKGAQWKIDMSLSLLIIK